MITIAEMRGRLYCVSGHSWSTK